jgi:hypothetical protein
LADLNINGNDMLTNSTQAPGTDRQFFVCVQNEGYEASLELHKIYRSQPDEEAKRDGDLRIIDESGEDYLYPADWFVAIDLPQPVEQSLLRAA